MVVEQQADHVAEGALSGDGCGAMVGEQADGGRVVAGGSQPHDEASDVAFERVHAVLGELGATANWRRLAEELWPWVSAAPQTELGRQEAAWRAATGRGAVAVGFGAS